MAIYKLEDVITMCNTLSDKSIDRYYIDLTSVKDNKYKKIKGNSYPSRAKWEINGETILIGRVRPKNKSHALISFNNWAASSGFFAFKNNKIIELKYLWYVLNSVLFIEYTLINANGSAYPEIATKDLLKYKFEVPILSKQKKIIDIIEPIERLFFKYSNCIRLDTLTNTKNDVKKIIDIIEPIEMIELKISNILNNLYKISNYEKKETIKNQIYWNSKGYSYKPHEKTSSGIYRIFSIKNISNSKAEKTNIEKCNKLNIGDVVTGLSGTIGTAGIVKQNDWVSNQRTLALRSDFALQIKKCIENSKVYLNSISTGAVQKNIKHKDILNLNFSIKNYERELKISNLYIKLVEILDKIVTCKTNLINLLVK